jgi:hypothetical protein
MAAEAWVTLVVEHRLDGLLHVFTCPAVPRFLVRRRAPRTAYGEIRSQLAAAIAELTGFEAEVWPREPASRFVARAARSGRSGALSHEYLIRLSYRSARSSAIAANTPQRLIRLLRASR